MYNFPCSTNFNAKLFIAKTFEDKLWVKCLAEFLTEIEFYQKTENGVLAETKEDP